MEHGHVLGHGHLVRGLVERVEVGVHRAAVVVAQLAQRDLEVGPQLDQREHAPLRAGDAVAGRGRRRGSMRPRLVAE